LIKTLAAQNKHLDAIRIGFNVLSKLGVQCQLPLPDKSIILEDMIASRDMITNMSDTDFLGMKEMNDPNMITAMKFFQILTLCTFIAMQDYFALIVSHMMKLTAQYGICKESCAALACCSFLDGTRDFEASEQLAHFAMILTEKLKAVEYQSQVYCLIYTLQGWRQHIKLSLTPLMKGYGVGMQTGAIEYAMLNIYSYLSHTFFSGQNLVVLERDLKTYMQQMIEYKQASAHHIVSPVRDAVSKLICSTTDCSLRPHEETYYSLLFATIVSYIFCDYKLALELLEKRLDSEKLVPRNCSFFGTKEFFDGLIYLAVARSSPDLKWFFYLKANQIISKLESFVQIGKFNSEHKLLLLQAESECVSGDKDVALNKYKLAIATAKKRDFIQEQAIANERLADFFLRHGDSNAAREHYGEAHSLYIQWGAKGKASHMCQNIPF